MAICNSLRLFRVFRVMKFSKYLTWVKLIIAALSDSLIPLSMAIFVMTIALLIFASVLFFVEVQGGQAVFVPEQKMWVYKSTGDPVRRLFFRDNTRAEACCC